MNSFLTGADRSHVAVGMNSFLTGADRSPVAVGMSNFLTGADRNPVAVGMNSFLTGADRNPETTVVSSLPASGKRSPVAAGVGGSVSDGDRRCAAAGAGSPVSGLRGSEVCSRTSGGGNDPSRENNISLLVLSRGVTSSGSQPVNQPEPTGQSSTLMPGPLWVGPRHDFSRESLVQPVLVQAVAGVRGGLTS
ncbi:hypothetical protein ACOMHN_027757 [Nucella lapillus]